MTFVFDVATVFTNFLEEKQRDTLFPLGGPAVVQPVPAVRTAAEIPATQKQVLKEKSERGRAGENAFGHLKNAERRARL